MLVRYKRPTVDYQCWYNVGKQLTQPYSDCGKCNFPIVDVGGLASVSSAPVVDCKIPAFETMLDAQQAQPSSDCGKSNFPTVNVKSPPSV